MNERNDSTVGRERCQMIILSGFGKLQCSTREHSKRQLGSESHNLSKLYWARDQCTPLMGPPEDVVAGGDATLVLFSRLRLIWRLGLECRPGPDYFGK